MLSCMRLKNEFGKRPLRLCKNVCGLSRATLVLALIFAPAASAMAQDTPVISEFQCSPEFGDYWTLTGIVTDNDDSVEGDVVVFGGVLAAYNITTPVEVDGTFSTTLELPGLTSGQATAQTYDPHNAASNLALTWVTP